MEALGQIGYESDRVRPRHGAATLNVYFDSSAVVKLLVAEPGSDVAAELWEASSLRVASVIAYPETRAALAAAARLGRIGTRALNNAVRDLGRLWPAIATIAIDDELARVAGEAAQRFALRGYDAVQLACALSVGDEELVLATWDRDLQEAALEAGCVVAPAKV